MEQKKWYESRTLWTGIIIFVGSLLQHFGVVQLDISTDATWVATAWGVIQTILRMVTTKPVTGNDTTGQ